jgi:hypothetical protein
MPTYIVAKLAEYRMAELRRVGPAQRARNSGSRRRIRVAVGRSLVHWGQRLATPPAPRPATR